MVDESGPKFQFFNRVSSLPFMTAAMEEVLNFYSRTKQQNRFLKYTMETAENALKFGAETAKPIIIKITPVVVDNFACQQLDKIEKNYPLVTKPVAEIVEASMIAINNLKTYGVNTLINAKQYGYNEVESLKKISYAKIKSVKDYELVKMSSRFDGNLRKLFHANLNSAVVSYEKYLDHYLPLENANERNSESESVKNLTARVLELNYHIPHRLHFHAQKHLSNLSKRAQDKIKELHTLITLLQERSFQSIRNYNEQVRNLFLELNKESSQTYQAFQEQLLHRARFVTKSLINIFNQASAIMVSIPNASREKLLLAKKQLENLYASLKQIHNVNDISKVTLTNLQEFVTSALYFSKLQLSKTSDERMKSRNKNLEKKEA